MPPDKRTWQQRCKICSLLPHKLIRTYGSECGGAHYDMMVLVYVDGILIFAKDPKMTIDKLEKMYELKAESV